MRQSAALTTSVYSCTLVNKIMARLQSVKVYLYPGGIAPGDLEHFGQYGQLRQEMRSCGKGCACCPHGPYWYLVWHEKGTNKAKKRYIGRNLPPVSVEPERYLGRRRQPEVEAHGIVMQLLPKGGRYNLAKIRERWEMEMAKRRRVTDD